MANDPNKLNLEVAVEGVEQSKRKFSELEDAVKKNQQAFEKLTELTKSIKGLPKSGQKATQSFRGLTNALKKSSDPVGMVTKQISDYQKTLGQIQSRMSKKSMLGQDTLKETEELKRLTTNITAYSKAIKSNKYLKELSASTSQQMLVAEQQLSQAEEKQANELQTYSIVQKELQSILDPFNAKMGELKEKLAEASEEFIKLGTSGKDTSGVEKNIKKIRKEMDKLESSTKKSSKSWRVLLGRIKNIAIYRTIRTALHWLTSGIQEGVDNLVQYDKVSNDTMSNINASVAQIKNTMGVAFMSVLQALEPIITSLASSLVDLINSFNLAMAKMSGEDTYTKAKKSVDDYAKSLQKVKKFSFDAFEVLSGNEEGKTPAQEMFEEGKVEEDANSWSKLFENVLTIVKSIAGVIKEVWDTLAESGALQVIVEVFGEVLHAVGSILKVVAKLIAGLNEIGLLKPLLLGIAAAFVVIKGAAIAAAIASAAQTIMSNPYIGIPAVLAGAAMLGVIGGKLLASSRVEGFAEGGFTNANLIATNENGKREWIGRNANATAVVNDTQMSQVMYQAVSKGSYEGMVRAIYETGMADAYSSKLVIDANGINDSAFARAIFPALKVESTRMGGNQL